MKKITTLILSLLLCLTSFGYVFAQDTTTTTTTTEESTGDYTLETQIDENTTKATNKYFDLTLTQELQSPLDNSILYTLTVVPHINSAKTQMTWNSSSASLSISPRTQGFVSMATEQEYSYKAVVRPTAKGTFTISVSVVSWQYDTNYTNSVEDTLVLSKELVSQPVGTPYILLLVLEILIIVGIIVLAIWGIKKLVKKYSKKAKSWLTPPR